MREERYKKLAVCLLIGIVLVIDICSGQIHSQSEEKYVFDAPTSSHRNTGSGSRQTLAIHPKRETTFRTTLLQRTRPEPIVPPVCYAPYQSEPRSSNEIYYGNIVAKSVLNLANKIGNSLSYTRAVKTQVFSPLSIAGALSLVLMGSNGNTFSEIMNTFGYDDSVLMRTPVLIHKEFGSLIQELINNQINRPISPWKCQQLPEELKPDTGYRGPLEELHQISVANGIFVQNDFSLNPDYETAVKSIYSGEISRMDFRNPSSGAVNRINEWVYEKTHGKIKNILGNGISADAKMIITSALYFKGLWERSFIKGGTSMKNFYPDGESEQPVQVEMMANGGVFPYYNSEEYDCRILGLPYKGNLSTMYIILPNNSSREKLRSLQRRLTAEVIEGMISNMRMKTAVMIFPKMHIENSINLRDILSGLGMRSFFDPAASDLSLISGGVDGSVRKPVKDIVQLDNNYDLRPFIVPQPNPNTSPRTKLRVAPRMSSDNYDSYQWQNQFGRTKRAVKYKVESSFRKSPEPLRLKDLIIFKRITKLNPEKKSIRHRRQAPSQSNLTPGERSLLNLDEQRRTRRPSNPGLFAENIVHKVDLTINEKGTEGGAATVAYLTRSGTDVIFRVDTPFMFLIRHEPTKLPIFYGSVFEPVNNI